MHLKRINQQTNMPRRLDYFRHAQTHHTEQRIASFTRVPMTNVTRDSIRTGRAGWGHPLPRAQLHQTQHITTTKQIHHNTVICATLQKFTLITAWSCFRSCFRQTSSTQIALVTFALRVSKVIALVIVQGQTQLALEGTDVVPHDVRILSARHVSLVM